MHTGGCEGTGAGESTGLCRIFTGPWPVSASPEAWVGLQAVLPDRPSPFLLQTHLLLTLEQLRLGHAKPRTQSQGTALASCHHHVIDLHVLNAGKLPNNWRHKVASTFLLQYASQYAGWFTEC